MEYLFHYTNPEKAKLILKSKHLKAGKFYKSNDPMEDFKLGYFSEIDNDENSQYIEELINKELQDSIYFHSFSEGTLNLKNELFQVGYSQFEDIRDGYFYPRMWTQYGSNHEGVCLVFDKSKIIDYIKKFNSRYNISYDKINYVDVTTYDFSRHFEGIEFNTNLNTLKELKIKGFISKLINDRKKIMYFTKDIDWAGEREFRILFHKNKNKNNIEPFIPLKNSLKYIFFGAKSKSLIENMDDYDYLNIKKIGLSIQNGLIMLNYDE